jgi:adenosylmethionine-8-amino-7-oxononanoate aminotransferase
MAGIELVKNRATKERFPPRRRLGVEVCDRMRKEGVLLRPLGDVIVIMPPLAIDSSLLDRIGDVLYNALSTITE